MANIGGSPTAALRKSHRPTIYQICCLSRVRERPLVHPSSNRKTRTAANESSMRAILFLTALLVTQASAKSPKRNAFATIHYEGTANDDGKQCATLPSTPARRHSHTAPLAALWRYRRHPRYHPGATLVVCYCCLLGARPVVWQSTSSVSAP